jgi:hypothetical protein
MSHQFRRLQEKGGYIVAGIGLADVVQDLRAELEQAVAASKDQVVRFDLGPIELTLSVAMTREATPGAKVKFWVIEAGADATFSRASTQQLKLTLAAVDARTAPAPKAGSVRIAGSSEDDERQ